MLVQWLYEWQGQSVGPPCLSRPKYLHSYRMDCREILYRRSWSPEDESYWLWWSLFHISSSASIRLTFLVQTEISWQLLGGLSWNFPRASGLMNLVTDIFGWYWNISTTIGWIAMKSGTDIHCLQSMNCNNFDCLTYRPLQVKIWVCPILIYKQIPALTQSAFTWPTILAKIKLTAESQSSLSGLVLQNQS